MNPFKDALEKLSEDLRNKGLDTYSCEIEKLAAGLTTMGFPSRQPSESRKRQWGEPTRQKPTQTTYDPSEQSRPEALKPGDLYTELYWEGGKPAEQTRVWSQRDQEHLEKTLRDDPAGILKTETTDWILRNIQTAPSTLKRLVDAYIETKDPYLKGVFGDEINKEALKQRVNVRLSSIQESLAKKGYTSASERIASIQKGFLGPDAAEESPEAPSLERLYEDSGSSMEFEQKLQDLIKAHKDKANSLKSGPEGAEKKKKLVDIYDGIANVIEMAAKSYKTDREDPEKIKKLIRGTDLLVHLKHKQLGSVK